ncbi:hypothetical protein OROHE_011095 [Orobanche hederae]
MEAAAVINSGQVGITEADSDAAFFHRRIEFHVARKPFSGLGNNTNNGFKLVTLNPNPEPNKASGPDKKCERSSVIYETGLDPELSFEITFRRIGAGLRNLGNTCFLNSVLQCLTYTEPLAAYLQSGKHQNSCISRNFRNARQEDAHEYMVNLLESMHKCCLPSGVPSESPSAYEKSLVHKIFGGHLRSQVKCMQCSYCSNKFDPFLDLSLEILRADSLLKALAHFTAKEQLDGGTKQYHCQQCKQKVKALKQLTIHKAPHVLTVHLKRFSSDTPGQKIDKKISFGPTLDLKPFVTGSYDGGLNYTLYGVLVHAGWNTHSGHYYCFVRTSSGMWYSLDDNQVFQVNERRVLEQKAYMLFYVRDRKNFVTKKPVDFIPKENMVTNPFGNTAYAKLNQQLKEKIQSGTVEKKIDEPSSATTLSERDAQKESPHRKIPIQNGNGTIVDNLGHKRDLQSEHSSVVPLSKDTLKVDSITGINPVDGKGGSRSVGGGSIGTPNLSDENNKLSDKSDISKDDSIMGINSVDEKGGSHLIGGDSIDTLNLSDENNSLSVVEDQNASGVKLPDFDAPHDSLCKKESEDFVALSFGGSCKTEGTNSEMRDSKIMPMEAVAEVSNKIDNVKALQQNSIDESQVGGSTEQTDDLKIEGSHENVQRLEAIQSGLLSQHSSLGEMKKKSTELKQKRKLFKYQVPTMSLSSNIMFGMGLCMRKKKLKRRKDPKKSPNPKNVAAGNNLSSDIGGSISDNLLPSLNGSRSQKKKSKCNLDGENQNSRERNISGEGSDNEIRERIIVGGTTLSAEKQSEKSQPASQGPISVDNQMERRQIDVMSILTRGLEEKTVARWDGIDASRTEIFETKIAGTSQIGYIGDEWDEEYDRGKRKKVRASKISFDGPNLFQEIATENSKRKRAKLNRVENQPFRI